MPQFQALAAYKQQREGVQYPSLYSIGSFLPGSSDTLITL